MDSVPFPIGPCVITLVMLAAWWDIETRRIPNVLVGLALAVALPVQWYAHGWIDGSLEWLGGCAVGGALLLPGYLMRLMGAGDVKLLAAVGAFCGASGAFGIGLVSFAVSGVAALVVLVWRRQALAGLTGTALLAVQVVSGSARSSARADADAKPASQSILALPFGVAIALGSAIVLFASV